MNQIYKYPRTKHISGSNLQEGDEDLSQVSYNSLKDKNLIYEEKMDGANSGISVVDSKLMLQSRGHYLTGGYRERYFDLFKTWANRWKNELKKLLGNRYIMYGEYLYAKHTIYYDKLPHYWMEFDIYDKENNIFLDTPTRYNMLKDFPFIVSVKLIKNKKDLKDKITKSHFITDNYKYNLETEVIKNKLNINKIIKETDLSGNMEGLYIKHEENGIVKGRYKFVRHSFTQNVIDSEAHWIDRPILPNKLDGDINKLFYEI